MSFGKRFLGKSSFLVLRLVLCVLAISAVSALSACGLRGGPEPGTLRINLGAEPPSLDWHVTTDSVSFDVVSNIMIGLAQYTNDLKVVPGCAGSWDISDGGKHYVFHIRKDIKWTDGKQLTARDFEYAWKRLLNPETGAEYSFFLYPIVNAFEYNTGKIKDPNLIGVKCTDDFTLDVRLKKPAAYFINLAAFCPTYPMREDIVKKHGDRWTEPENIVTNGPFLVKAWRHEYKIELDSNPTFFEGEPELKHIKLFMVPEQATAFALYENDELDFVDNRSFSTPDVTRYRNSPEYHNFPLLRVNYMGFNVEKKPVNDPRVRKAIAMAIDRSVFPKILRRGEQPIYTWIPPALPGYSPESAINYDPEGARKLLAEAGYPDGKGFPTLGLLFPNREDVRVQVEVMQDQLKRNLGIPVELVNQEWKVYLATLRRDAPPMYRASWGADFADPETFANLFTSNNGNNNTRWKNPEYDHIVDMASAEQDPEKRKRLYIQADTMLCRDQVPMTPTFQATQNCMVKPWVSGIAFNALDFQFFKTVKIDPTRTK